MSRRVCTTQAGTGTCCAAITQYGQAQAAAGFKVNTKNGVRCMSCTVITKKPSKCSPNAQRMGFQVRFKPNSTPTCGIGPGGCPALATAGAGAAGGQTALLPQLF